MRRFILYAAAATILTSVIVTVHAVTTIRPQTPPCPMCGACDAIPEIRHQAQTIYTCQSCQRTFQGPGSGSFSWLDAIEDWLNDERMIE